MLLLDQSQAGLGLDLGVVKRSPRERDRGALTVDEALSGRMALATGPLQSEVEQSQRELIALREPQRVQSQETRVRDCGRRQPGGERGLHVVGCGSRRLPMDQLL